MRMKSVSCLTATCRVNTLSGLCTVLPAKAAIVHTRSVAAAVQWNMTEDDVGESGGYKTKKKGSRFHGSYIYQKDINSWSLIVNWGRYGGRFMFELSCSRVLDLLSIAEPHQLLYTT
jgi:hypothetical protein